MGKTAAATQTNQRSQVHGDCGVNLEIHEGTYSEINEDQCEFIIFCPSNMLDPEDTRAFD